jgi:hypothetical protein
VGDRFGGFQAKSEVSRRRLPPAQHAFRAGCSVKSAVDFYRIEQSAVMGQVVPGRHSGGINWPKPLLVAKAHRAEVPGGRRSHKKIGDLRLETIISSLQSPVSFINPRFGQRLFVVSRPAQEWACGQFRSECKPPQ